LYRYSKTAEKISGSSSGREMRLLPCEDVFVLADVGVERFGERNWDRRVAAKKDECERTSSCAAKRRCAGPTVRVTIGEVRLEFGEVSSDGGKALAICEDLENDEFFDGRVLLIAWSLKERLEG
jgi:hypothetical protein